MKHSVLSLSASAAAGAVYALAFPPVGAGWLAFPALATFLWLVHESGTRRALASGFVFGVTAFGISLSWLWNLFGAFAIVLWCVLAVFPAFFAWTCAGARRLGACGWVFACFAAVNWCAWEFIRAELFPLKFPWMTAGLAIGPCRATPWIGVYGTGALMVLGLAALPLWRKRGLLVAGIVALLVGTNPGPQRETGMKVAGVQREGVTIDEYATATRSLPGDVRIVVWPEYAVPYDLRKNPRDGNHLRELCREKRIMLVLGTRRDETEEIWRNIALTMDAVGEIGFHTKAHPVHFFDDGKAGETAEPVRTPHGKIGTPVCFDGDYEGVFRRMTKAGAEFFLVPVMDAESWSARQHAQHAELYRMRAAENGRWVFVCATSGVSQLVDPHGHVHRKLGAMEKGTLAGRMERRENFTVYTRFGWFFPWLCLGSACVGLPGMMVAERIRSGKRS